MKKTAPTQMVAGVPFDYQIFITIPAGSTGVVLTDMLPTGLTYIGYSVSPSLNLPSTTLIGTPVPGVTPFKLQWNGAVTAGANGTVTITVMFPNGTSCNGAAVRNSACLEGKAGNGQALSQGFCTEPVSTTPMAVDPWFIYKQPLGTYLQSGASGQCPNLSATRTIRYRITVSKTPGLTGQMSLFDARVEDPIPDGTGFNIINIPSGTTATYTGGPGGKVIWTLNDVLDATPMYNSKYIDFEITYPNSATFPVSNTATLFGNLAKDPPASPCGTVSRNSNTTCVALLTTTPVGNLEFTKNATLGSGVPAIGGVIPGCTFLYVIRLRNSGTAALSGGYTVTDNLPAGVSITGAGDVSVNDMNFSNGVPTGFTVSATTNSFTVTTTNSLAAGASHWIYVQCTLSSGASGSINNCADVTAPFLPAPVRACAKFDVVTIPARACITKSECSPVSRPLGSTFRYRIAMRNIGGQNVTGASVLDALHPSLQYVATPAPSYYQTNGSLPACAPAGGVPTGATAWTGAPAGPTVSGQNISWSGVNLPKTCNAFPNAGCGSGAFNNEPLYFIEFTVRVRDTSAIGHVPNFVTISGGGLPAAVTSNTWITHITGSPGFNLRKTFIQNNVDSLVALSLPGGSTTRYKLNFTNGSVALRGLTFVDLLPKDVDPNDYRIFGRITPFAVRTPATAFDLTYTGGDTYSPAATEGASNPIGQEDANINTLSGVLPGISPLNLFPYNTGGGAWSAPGTIPTNTENLYYHFGTTPIGAAAVANAQFNVQVPPGTPATRRACNSFAANAYHLQVSPVNPLAASNASNYGRVALTPAESNNACITTLAPPDTCCPRGVLRPQNKKCCSTIDLYGLPNCVSPIKSVGLGGISGGVITSIVATGVGTGSGTNSIVFGTPVTPTTTTPLTLEVCGAATAPSGLVSYVVNTVLANAASTRCTYRDTLYCNPCDTLCKTKLAVKRCVCNGSSLDYLTLNVTNQTTPNLPICSIKVTASSLNWTTGAPYLSPVAGSVAVSGNMATFTPSVPATFVNGAMAQFQLFYPHASTFPGSITVVVDYCGKACDTTFTWRPVDVPPNGNDAIVRLQSTTPQYSTLYQAAFRLEKAVDPAGTRPVKFIGISVPVGGKAKIVAVTGAALTKSKEGDLASDYLQLKESSHGLKNALFELPEPMTLSNLDQGRLHVIFGEEKPAQVDITLYTEDGSILYNRRQAALAQDNASDRSSGAQTIQVLDFIEGSPNPVRDEYNVRYEADGARRYKLLVLNPAGQTLQVLDLGTPEAGLQSVTVNAADLPEGSYFVRLETEQGKLSGILKFVVIR